jgi:hypothetical protein
MKEEKQSLRLNAVITKLTSIHQLCKEEAEKSPVGKDLFQSGKQAAYSHMYFVMKPILERAKWIDSDRIFYMVIVPIITFCLGFLSCMGMFNII